MNSTHALTPSHEAFLKAQQRRLDCLRQDLDQLCLKAQTVVLEIGCGHGHYLTAYAQQHPEASCLGIDLVTKRIQLACQKRDKRAVRNLNFLKAEVREVLSVWPERLLVERVFILYPDPWPKNRHIKNRIIQTQLLDRLAEITLPGACLHFRTDHEGHFAWANETISTHSAWKVAPAAAWPFENPSYFQELFGIHESLTAVRR